MIFLCFNGRGKLLDLCSGKWDDGRRGVEGRDGLAGMVSDIQNLKKPAD